MQFSTDPKVIGPGSWFILHWTAWLARDEEEINFFIKTLRTIIDNFPCGDCKKHATQFIGEHPPEEYKDWEYEGQRLGMFYYMNMLHNWPNKRLGKKIISFQECYQAFDSNNTGFCSEGCGHESDNNDNDVTVFTPQNNTIGTAKSYMFIPKITKKNTINFTTK